MLFKKLGYIILGILLSIILLLTSIEIVAFNLTHYRKSFDKYNIIEATSMDMENLEHTIDDLLKYLKDDREELDTRAVIKGEEREVFGNREKFHMVDVKELFMKGRLIRNISIPLIIIISFFIIRNDKYWKKALSKTLLYTAICNIVILATLLILMAIDFYKYFTYFHLIFFTNDLWLLNPNTDVLIQMVPEAFFYDTAVKIIIYFVGSLIILGLLGLYSIKRNKTQYGN